MSDIKSRNEKIEINNEKIVTKVEQIAERVLELKAKFEMYYNNENNNTVKSDDAIKVYVKSKQNQ